MGGQENDSNRKNNDTDKLMKTTPSTDSHAKVTSSPSQNITPPSATISPPAPLQQGRIDQIDQTQWSCVEWFGNSHCWQNDFAKWIILALEEKESSVQIDIEKGLDKIEGETHEIFKAGTIDSESYNFCLDLITKCKNIRLKYVVEKRNELLGIIFNYLQMEFNPAVSLIEAIGQMSVEQRSVLRFMTHQKIQARVAFLRTTLKTHKDSHHYHCISNPYYNNLLQQKQAATTRCSSLQETIDGFKASSIGLNDEYNKLLDQNDELIEKNNELKEQLETEQKKHNDSLLVKEFIDKIKINNENETLEQDNKMKEYTKQRESEYEARIKKREDEMKSENETCIKQLKERMKSKYEARTKQLQERMKSEHGAQIDQLQEEAEKLREEARSAKDEALNYQAALGNATNIRWSDSTFNNPIQLTKNIEKFQHSLADFTRVKGKLFKIDENAARQLLTQYGCKANLNDKEIKNYLAAALQRMVLETIFASADGLYKFGEKTEAFPDRRHIESFIVYYNQNLVKYTTQLALHREGQDSVTAIAPVKIRQQVYAALGSRGFAKPNHPLLKKLVNDIMGKMEKCREVVDEKKKEELHIEAEKIVRTGMQLWFCLKAQEPVPTIHWHKSGSNPETHLMDLMVGSGENENIKEMEVDFAFFPLIITEHDSQVFNKAQVFVRPKQNGKLRQIKDYAKSLLPI